MMQLKEAQKIHKSADLLLDQLAVEEGIADLASRVANRLATLGKDVLWKAYPQNDLKDRHVIIIDDIFDQGYTLEEVKSYCIKHGAKKCSSVFLIRKTHDRKKADIQPDYTSLECDDCYVYGAGMDLDGYFRNLSSIYFVKSRPW